MIVVVVPNDSKLMFRALCLLIKYRFSEGELQRMFIINGCPLNFNTPQRLKRRPEKDRYYNPYLNCRAEYEDALGQGNGSCICCHGSNLNKIKSDTRVAFSCLCFLWVCAEPQRLIYQENWACILWSLALRASTLSVIRYDDDDDGNKE